MTKDEAKAIDGRVPLADGGWLLEDVHDGTCQVVNSQGLRCANPTHALGLCVMHNQRLRRHGSVRADVPARPRGGDHQVGARCSFIEPETGVQCERTCTGKSAKGLCHTHYQRLRRGRDKALGVGDRDEARRTIEAEYGFADGEAR